MTDLGERLDDAQLDELQREIDADQSTTISLEEFSHAIPKFVRARAALVTPEFSNDFTGGEDGGMRRRRRRSTPSTRTRRRCRRT